MADAAAENIVNVRTTCTVKPAIPPPTQRMFLSSFDLFWMRMDNVQAFFFYKLSPTIEYSSVIGGLKKSLSSILVYFYPLAGRLKTGESGRAEVDLTEVGVIFKEVSISIKFEDLEKDGFQRKPFFKNLSPELDGNYGISLLSIQVTEFEGGGICIGTTFHHVIVDGTSYIHFMNSWAECNRGLPIANPPQLDRTVFKRENKTSPSISYKAHDIVSVGIKGAMIFKFVPDDSQLQLKMTVNSENGEDCGEDLQKRTDLIHFTFCFREDMIKELKNKSRAKSSFVAVAAQFWRCVVRAREVPQEEAVHFVMFADCRGRVKPPLLPTYFGNCVSPGVAETTAETLINSDISFAADVIQQLISSFTEEEQIHYFIEWVESCNIDVAIEGGWKYGTRVASSPRFPVYAIDYGWGKSADAHMADPSEIGSMVLLPPKDGGKSMMVSTCLPQQQMDFLQHLLFST